SLVQISRGTVSKILTPSQIRPHKISYYLERRDPTFEAKMAQVLYVYKEVEMLRQTADQGLSSMVAVLSYDEKPGIQALENTAPDLPRYRASRGNGHAITNTSATERSA